MNIDRGDKVVASDGTDLGRVLRVVLDPRTKEVSHLVVSGGFLTADRVVPVELVTGEEGGSIRLSVSVDVDGLPRFEEQYAVPLSRLGEQLDYDDPVAWYHPYGVVGAYPTFLDFGPAPVAVERNIPPGEVPLEIGARVSSPGGERLGEVDEVIVNPDTDRVESFVVASGAVLRHRTLVPVGWVDTWDEGEVRLAVGRDVLEDLPKFTATS